MEETQAPPATEADSGEPGGPDWGRLLDAAGIAAGVLLLVIVADIWTDGRLISRRLQRGPQDGDQGDPGNG